MGFVEAVKTCYGPKYAQFSGRAARSEYWYFMLAQTLILLALVLVGMATGALSDINSLMDASTSHQSISISPINWLILRIGALFYLGTVLPASAVSVRRLHDRSWSAWLFVLYLTLPFIQLAGTLGDLLGITDLVVSLLFFITTVRKGTPGTNTYGPDPLGQANQSSDVFA